MAAVCGLLVGLVALVFGQTAGHGFVNFDDNEYVYDNPHVAGGWTRPAVAWAFTERYANNWHPLAWLSHMLDCQVFGLKWPGGHHLANVLLHAASAVLLFLVLRQMTGAIGASAFVAALFAVHPLHVESVAWVAERKDVLSGLLFLLALAAYLGYARRPFSLVRYLLVTLLVALGLMAKPMLVTLPLVLLLLDYWPLGRLGPPATGRNRITLPPRVLLEKLPWLGLTVVSCILTHWAQQQAMNSLDCPFAWRVANAVDAYAVYLGQFFYPAKLAVLYPHPLDTLPPARVLAAAVLLFGVSVVAFAMRRKRPYLLVGWLWYLGMLVPVIGLVQVGVQARADRYTYLPQIGIGIALAWAAAEFAGTSATRRRACLAAALAVVAIAAACAWRQAAYWKDSETLWTRALACTSRNWLAHNNLGKAFADRGRTDAAIEQYEQSLTIKPDQAVAHNNLGLALARRSDGQAAVSHYKKALDLMPRYAEAHNNLGLALAQGGDVDAALTEFRTAVDLQPENAEAQNNLGNALAGRSELDAAIPHFRRAVALKPDYANAHYNLGLALAACGQNDAAIEQFQAALAIHPEDRDARRNLEALQPARGRP